MKKILVVGSSNIDMTANVEHLPIAGETIGNVNISYSYGGKGANQAVAAARLGGNVEFITSLGNDNYSEKLRHHFKAENLKIDNILIDTKKPTGTAIIFVGMRGENCIAVAPGSNYSLFVDSIPSFDSIIETSDLVMLQAEIPYETNKQIAFIAKSRNIPVVFNPAPACKIDSDFFSAIDTLILNETEAAFVSEIECNKNNLEKISELLLAKGVKNVIITLGSEGAYFQSMKDRFLMDAYDVRAIDTVAAGDTFCGAIAVARVNGEIDTNAMSFASAASALAVMKHGAQSSIPTQEAVLTFLKEHKSNIA